MVPRARISQSDIDAYAADQLWEYAAKCHPDPTIVNDAKLYGVDIVRLYQEYAKQDWLAVAHVFKMTREKAFQVLMDYAVAGETIRDEPLWKQLFDPDRVPDHRLTGWFVRQWELFTRFSFRGRPGKLTLKRATRLLQKRGLARDEAESAYLLERLVYVGEFEYHGFFGDVRTAQLTRQYQNGETYYWLIRYESPGI